MPDPETRIDIKALLYSQVTEPVTTRELLDQWRSYGLDFSSIVGDINDPFARMRAALILRYGEPEKGRPDRIIGTFVNGHVSGMIFNPFDERTVKTVVDLKSSNGNPRKELFAVLCNFTTMRNLADLSQIEKPLEPLIGDCFVQLPARADIGHFLPKYCWQNEIGPYFVQFFIPKPGSHLEKVIESATAGMEVPVMAGTSGQFSGGKSLVNRYQAATFSVCNDLYWLDAPGTVDGQKRDSFTIVRIVGSQMTEIRPGNVPFAELEHRVDGARA